MLRKRRVRGRSPARAGVPSVSEGSQPRTNWLLCLIVLIALGIGPVGPAQAQPKYVISLIGDGTGPEQARAAGMYAYGAPGTLSFEMFPFSGDLTDDPASGGIPDSAAAATLCRIQRESVAKRYS